MFWKRKKPPERIESLQMLRLWRSPQDDLIWEVVDHTHPFPRYFDSLVNIVIFFDREWSVVRHRDELKEMIRLLNEKAAEELGKDKTSKTLPQIITKAVQYADKKFRLVPFVRKPRAQLLSFMPPQEYPLSLSMRVLFLSEEEKEAFFDKKRQRWFDQLDPEQIDAFVQKKIKEKFLLVMSAEERQDEFDSLSSIMSAIDLDVLSDKPLSHQYLKHVWGIPFYVFGDDQERAAFMMLSLQKAYQSQRQTLVEAFTPFYQAKLLKWLLFRSFSVSEIQRINALAKNKKLSEEFLQTAVFDLYKQVLNQVGVPVELAELYGAEVFLDKITKIFAQFPKQEMEMAALPNHSQYTLLLEDAVRFCTKHINQADLEPEVLLRQLVRIMVQRMAEFQERKKEE